MRISSLAAILGLMAVLGSCRPKAVSEEVAMKGRAPETTKVSFSMTDEDFRKKLSPEQYAICRQGGTEPPGTGQYLHHTGTGLYQCAACDQPLYTSRTKYDACGWPSFWDALPGAVRQEAGREAVCSRCGSHLGHIFDDGPPPTGKRH